MNLAMTHLPKEIKLVIILAPTPKCFCFLSKKMLAIPVCVNVKRVDSFLNYLAPTAK